LVKSLLFIILLALFEALFGCIFSYFWSYFSVSCPTIATSWPDALVILCAVRKKNQINVYKVNTLNSDLLKNTNI